MTRNLDDFTPLFVWVFFVWMFRLHPSPIFLTNFARIQETRKRVFQKSLDEIREQKQSDRPAGKVGTLIASWYIKKKK